MSTSTANLPAGIAACRWRALGTTVRFLGTDPHRLETAPRDRPGSRHHRGFPRGGRQ